jgi:hypothetical protein
MCDRSPPQLGMGRRSKCLSDFNRRSSIHFGSLFSAEISRTTSSLKPFLGSNTGVALVVPAVLVGAELEVLSSGSHA